MKIEVVRAWPHRYESRLLELPDGATAGEAVVASGIDAGGIAGLAVYGERAEAGHELQDGDRVEMLGPLLADPKQARRRRAATGEKPRRGPG